MKPTPLFQFMLKQAMSVNGWSRIPRKTKKRWLRDYWNSLRQRRH